MTGPTNQYLAELRAALAGMTITEREEIVEEIRAHIEERSTSSGMPIEEVLRRLGPAAGLARDYNNGALVRRASRSRSPWFLLRATYHWAWTGIHGLVIFFMAFIGYAMGAALIVSAFLKPLFPENIGFWIGPDGAVFGMPSGRQGGRELLGPWYTQVAILLGLAFLIATTMAVRALLPKLKRSHRLARANTENAVPMA